MGFYIQDDYWEAVSEQPPKVQNEVMGALVRLFFTGEETNLSGVSKALFVATRERVKIARKNASNRNRKTETDATEKPDCVRIDSIKEGEGEGELKGENPKRGARMRPPSLDEARAYADEKGLVHVNVESWWSYYESQGWRKKNGLKVTNWKIALSGADSRDKPKGGGNAHSEYDDLF